MEGNDILAVAKKIKEAKEMIENARKEAIKRKGDQNEQFFKCKENCACERPCKAMKLKQCSMCGDVLKSNCSKSPCKAINEKKTSMLLPTAAAAGASVQ